MGRILFAPPWDDVDEDVDPDSSSSSSSRLSEEETDADETDPPPPVPPTPFVTLLRDTTVDNLDSDGGEDGGDWEEDVCSPSSSSSFDMRMDRFP